MINYENILTLQALAVAPFSGLKYIRSCHHSTPKYEKRPLQVHPLVVAGHLHPIVRTQAPSQLPQINIRIGIDWD